MDMQERARQFSNALVSEIKAEMGRQDLSSRALGRAIGKSSQYMSDRLDGGSSKTGERVALNVRDLSAIAGALKLSEEDLVRRANEALARGLAPVTSLSARRSDVSGSGETEQPDQDRIAAFEGKKIKRRKDDSEFFE